MHFGQLKMVFFLSRDSVVLLKLVGEEAWMWDGSGGGLRGLSI